jgi:Flp pilus assembly protein TadG
MLKRWLRLWLADEEGSVAVEMAILTPLLLLLLLGAADFAKVYRTQMLLVGAAKAGAQYGSQSKLTASDIAGMEAAARNDANGFGGLDVAAQTICKCSGAAVACTSTCAGGTMPEVFVEVSTAATFKTAFRYPGIPQEIPLAHTNTVRVE